MSEPIDLGSFVLIDPSADRDRADPLTETGRPGIPTPKAVDLGYFILADRPLEGVRAVTLSGTDQYGRRYSLTAYVPEPTITGDPPPPPQSAAWWAPDLFR
jgi:hypothetical protein